MDPFSITVGVISLVAISSRVGVELKKLRNGSGEATTNINAMLADLKALKAVLESIEEGFEELDSRTPLTGFIGTHWTALRTTLDDGCDSMDRLRTLLVHVNKDVKFLDSTRRAIRLKEANDQIAIYRQEIQTYKDAFQLSLQAVIFFEQSSVTENVALVLKSTGSIHDDLNRLANNLEVKLTALESIFKDRHQYSSTASVSHLQDCVTTASTVVTTASTVLLDPSHSLRNEEEDASSEFAWFQCDYETHSSLTLDWITSQNAEQSFSGLSDTNSQHITPIDVSEPSSARVSASIDNSDAQTIQNVEDTVQETQLMESDKSALTSRKPTRPPASTSRRSFSISKLFSSRPKNNGKYGNTADRSGPLQMNNLEILNGQVVMKFVFVGDGACGKTTFMIVASTGEFPREYIPTVFENYSSNHILDGVMFHLGLWDTAGQEDYDRLRPLSYPQTDMFCICYSIGSPAMFDSVAKKWSPEVDYHNGEVGAAKVLLGFQKDLRHDPSLIASLKRQGRKPVTKAEGEKLAKQIGAVAFLECSALTRDGVGEIFPTLLGMVLEANPGLKSKYSIHQKQQRSIRRIFAKP